MRFFGLLPLTSLRRTDDGKIVFFPWGRTRSNYLITQQELEGIVAFQNKAAFWCIVPVVLCAAILGLSAAIAVGIVFFCVYLWLFHRKLSRCPASGYIYAQLKPY